jgi:serine protease Do
MSSRHTIVIVEDDAAALESYGRLLRRLGHEVILEGACGASLLDEAVLRRAELLILDQQMPGLCGLDFLERLRAAFDRERHPVPPVLLITAFADAVLRRRASALGVEAVIDKPIDPNLLLGIVERLLTAAAVPAPTPWAPSDAPAAPAGLLTSSIGGSYTPTSFGSIHPGGMKEPPSMQKQGRFVTLAAIALGSVLFGMVLAGGLNLTLPGHAADSGGAADRPLHAAARAQMAAGTAPATAPASFADVVERVNPAVVSITATEVQAQSQRRPYFHGDPFEFFFGPQGPQQQQPGPQQGPRRRPQQMQPDQQDEPDIETSGGSGFFISDDGYILTNYHVVEGASKIKVNLTDDRHEYTAEVVGTDPSSDLALIKIEVSKKLAFLTLGDSDALRIGDWVIAVGNPLQYEHTVTVGVVSAKGRKLGGLSRDFSLDSFIQTDAAINFGNSGGPLINVEGEVVGVNTAISSVGQGIGFAVPSSIAKDVVTQLRAKGKVSRGYLGITVAEISPDMAEAWGLKNDRGALVQSVSPGLPADQAGVKKGDIITAIDGKPVATSDEVVRLISGKDPGSKVRMTVLRDGHEQTLTANLGDRPNQTAESKNGQGDGDNNGGTEGENETKLGLRVEEMTPAIVSELGLSRDTKGVVITHVSRVSEAWEKSLNQGDVITEVNRVPVSTLSEYRREIRKAKPGSLVVLYVINPPSRTGRDAVSRYVTLRVQKEEQ